MGAFSMPADVAGRRDLASPVDCLVIGGGPAGLMAAERLSARGARVVLADAKPSVGRKFLMAGKSGLNLTFDSGPDDLLTQFGEARTRLDPIIRAFDAQAIVAWAHGLGQEVFTGSSGRVFPVAMKASPLLRAWIGRLEGRGVVIRTRHRWRGWHDWAAVFDTDAGSVAIPARTMVLALGGSSWARLGSDGRWSAVLAEREVVLAPFRPSNAGLAVDWSAHMKHHFGQALKGVRLCAGAVESRGELVVSARGLEGGGVYAVFSAVRDGAPLILDLCPDLTLEQVAAKLVRTPAKASRSNSLRKAFGFDRLKIALLNEFARGIPEQDLARTLKAIPIRHNGPRPMDEAISTAGGVMWSALDERLMLKAMPGVYAAGEMIDWEAPTGGYLLTACLATGRWAGEAAADRLRLERPVDDRTERNDPQRIS